MVTSGTHVNDQCCFDYGNAETSGNDTGNGHMDAINLGTECWFSPCSGSGPWVQGDLENGLFQSRGGAGTDKNDTGDPQPYVIALLKNNGQNYWALKVGNAQSAGLPTDDADNRVQADIVSVGYGAPTGSTGSLAPGSEVALETSAPHAMTYLLADPPATATSVAVVTSSSSAATRSAATWIVRRGFAKTSCLWFEAKNDPGQFLRHYDFVLCAQPYDGAPLSAQDAIFCPVDGLSRQGTSSQSVDSPSRYLSSSNGKGVIAASSGDQTGDGGPSFQANASWIVVKPPSP